MNRVVAVGVCVCHTQGYKQAYEFMQKKYKVFFDELPENAIVSNRIQENISFGLPAYEHMFYIYE